jgi:tight adherence protein C
VLAAKAASAAIGLLAGVAVGSGLPARLALIAVPAIALAGFMAPDAIMERAASTRRRRLVAAMPDALDLLAVGVASGRSPSVIFAEIASGTGGPLAAELAVTVAEIECGASIAAAVADLRRRVPGAEVGALATALERSRRYGSPLADQLRGQATAMRRDARRRIEERSARAAPKIQLVVALVLVPSVLLMIAAAIIAHSDQLFAGF